MSVPPRKVTARIFAGCPFVESALAGLRWRYCRRAEQSRLFHYLADQVESRQRAPADRRRWRNASLTFRRPSPVCRANGGADWQQGRGIERAFISTHASRMRPASGASVRTIGPSCRPALQHRGGAAAWKKLLERVRSAVAPSGLCAPSVPAGGLSPGKSPASAGPLDRGETAFDRGVIDSCTLTKLARSWWRAA
jgi:hypothetical protein